LLSYEEVSKNRYSIIVFISHISRKFIYTLVFKLLRDLPEKYSYFKCQFYVTKTAKNSRRKQTVKRHFKPYLILKLNKNESDNLDIQTEAQYKPSQQKYMSWITNNLSWNLAVSIKHALDYNGDVYMILFVLKFCNISH
jgi:hypothetical protein